VTGCSLGSDAAVATVGLAGFFVHGLVDRPLGVIGTGIPVGLVVGLALVSFETTESDHVAETSL